MILPRLLTTQSFRLTALSALLFSLSALLVFGLVYWAATRFMAQQMDNALQAELSSLLENGGVDLANLVDQRLAAPSTREFMYLLEDKAGKHLAGNLAPMPIFEGWHDLPPLETQTGPDADDHVLRTFGKTLADGAFLVVARDIAELDEVADFMENSFAIGFAATLVVAFVCGGLVSAGFLRRLDGITRTTQDIMAGDLHRRIPLGSGRDDFAKLAVSLNAMLDRILELMEGVQQVSNDIAHDMRTPLTRLHHRLERARLKAQTTEDFQAAIDGALAETTGLLEMFSALLRIAKIETGARRADFVDVDFSKIAQTVVETYTPVAEDAEHTLAATIQSGISLQGDRQLLTQMLVNLVENALSHTPAGSTVTVDLRQMGSPSAFLLIIGDDGPGIPEEERSRVFRRFYRHDASRSTIGYGLGLSLVTAIVTLHQGEITLDDNAPGLRAVVRF